MRAKIYKLSKSVLQSGQKGNCWRLVLIEEHNSKFIEPLMHRVSSRGNQYQIALDFDSKESAIRYAKKSCLLFDLVEFTDVPIQKKSYLQN